MTEKRITIAAADEQIRQLYETALPQNEQIPWDVYRTYNDIIMTIMMRGEGTFTMQDWDDIIHELQQFWWPDDIKEG